MLRFISFGLGKFWLCDSAFSLFKRRVNVVNIVLVE